MTMITMKTTMTYLTSLIVNLSLPDFELIEWSTTQKPTKSTTKQPNEDECKYYLIFFFLLSLSLPSRK